ncbi:MAG: MBL fold metallo-hydrolase [Bradymonadales bacterium]|nr:MBL fold metallo-hydrolase [Bradymonadales bacterium]
MDLIILGSGTAYPDGDRGPSSYWVGEGETGLLVDCGSGICQKLARAGLDWKNLEAVCLTHAHPDHLGDLPALLFALRMPEVGRVKPLTVFHSPELTPYLDGLHGTYGDWLVPSGFEVRYQPVAAGQRAAVGRLTLESFAVAHHATSLGYRLQNGQGVSLAIPSDTGLCQSLVDHVQKVDCLVLECAATDDRPMSGHLTPTDVLYVLDHASPFTLLLTHLYPWTERAGVAQQVMAGARCPVLVARDGLAVEVRRGGVVVREENLLESGRGRPRGEGEEREGVVRSGEGGLFPSEELSLMHAMMDRELDRMDRADMDRRKYDFHREPNASGPGPTSRDEWGFERAVAGVPLWTEEDLVGLVPTRAQRKLLGRVSERAIQSEINLRGSIREDALARLEAVVPTWARTGVRLARIVTGKGKQSEAEPVVKLAVLNWITGPQGRRWVKEWAPVMAADGNFGSVVIELKR